jgi:hypothetical protein
LPLCITVNFPSFIFAQYLFPWSSSAFIFNDKKIVAANIAIVFMFLCCLINALFAILKKYATHASSRKLSPEAVLQAFGWFSEGKKIYTVGKNDGRPIK